MFMTPPRTYETVGDEAELLFRAFEVLWENSQKGLTMSARV